MRLSLRVLVLTVAALLAFVLPNAVELVTDWWWFGEVGHRQVFTAILRLKAGLGLATLVLALVWLVAHVKMAARTLLRRSRTCRRRRPDDGLPERREVETLGTELAAGAAVSPRCSPPPPGRRSSAGGEGEPSG